METHPTHHVDHKKYGVIQAVKDFLHAANRKPGRFAAVVAISYIVAGAALVVTMLAIGGLFFSRLGSSFSGSFWAVIGIIIAMLAYLLIYAFVYAFTISSIAICLASASGDFQMILKKAWKHTPRVLQTNIRVGVIAYWPMAAAFLFSLIAIGGTFNGASAIWLILLPIMFIATFVWAIIASLRYALAAQITIFEPHVPIEKTLSRSEELLKNGGQWFLFKGILLVFGALILTGVSTGNSLDQLRSSDDWLSNTIMILLSIVIEGVLVILYFNRTHKHIADK